jgi:hypothetical protein
MGLPKTTELTAMTEYRHSDTARQVLRSLVPVICPPEATGLGDAIVEHMALTLGASPAVLQRGFAAGLIAYDLGALPRYARRARSLRGDRAERYFAWWEHGPTPLHVQLARGVNQLMSLSCYEQPEMMERLGYRPTPWIAEVTRRRLTVYRDDARRQDAQILAPDPLRPGARVKPEHA